MIEVELKFPVVSLDELRKKLQQVEAQFERTVNQSDEYLNDPLRDFAMTDQALRIRSTDDQFFVTYKGPNLDPTAKIRKEIEIPLQDQAAAESLRQAFFEMNFYAVAKVVKRREFYRVPWQGETVEACLDDVEEVGGFCELELVVSDETGSDAAKQKLIELADTLQLSGSIRTSYLEMLLRNRGDL